MAFKTTRSLMIKALRDGRFQHEERTQAEGKNLLATGEISVEEVIVLLLRCRGNQHETRYHHFDKNQLIDIFKPIDEQGVWYIKSYLVDLDDIQAVFISVHR